jgi:hypothetical protein
VNGTVLASYNATQCILTARIPGVGFTTTEVDAKCTLVNTTPSATADPIGMGLAVLRDPTDGRNGLICKAANLTAKVATLTPVLSNNTLYEIEVIMPDGTTYTADYTSDADATAKEIVEGMKAALDASLPANTVATSEDDAVLTLTAEVPGQPFDIQYDGALWAYAVTTVGSNVSEDIAGVTEYDSQNEVSTSDTIEYGPNSAMTCMRTGRIQVETPSQVTPGDKVYVRTAGTGTMGSFTNVNTPGETLELSPQVAKWIYAASATLAELQISFMG